MAETSSPFGENDTSWWSQVRNAGGRPAAAMPEQVLPSLADPGEADPVALAGEVAQRLEVGGRLLLGASVRRDHPEEVLSGLGVRRPHQDPAVPAGAAVVAGDAEHLGGVAGDLALQHEGAEVGPVDRVALDAAVAGHPHGQVPLGVHGQTVARLHRRRRGDPGCGDLDLGAAGVHVVAGQVRRWCRRRAPPSARLGLWCRRRSSPPPGGGRPRPARSRASEAHPVGSVRHVEGRTSVDRLRRLGRLGRLGRQGWVAGPGSGLAPE